MENTFAVDKHDIVSVTFFLMNIIQMCMCVLSQKHLFLILPMFYRKIQQKH